MGPAPEVLRILQKALVKHLKFGSPIRYLGALALERERVKSFMHSKKQFLKPGNYKMLSLGKTIVYRDSDANYFLRKQAEEHSGFLVQLKLFLKQVLSNFFKVRIPCSEDTVGKYKGDFVLFTQAGDAKVFDLDNKVVLKFFYTPETYLRFKTTYAIFKAFFNIPIKGFCNKQQIVIENYVNSTASNFWSKENKQRVFLTYCENFSKYLKGCVKNKQFTKVSSSEILRVFPKNLKECKFYFTLNRLLKQSETKKWPHVKCHGDFWLGNVLLDGGNCYLIDWEHSCEHVFFYDVMHFMLLQALKEQDFIFFNAYFKGDYDLYIGKLFELADTDYFRHEKLLYLVICIAQRMVKFSDTTMAGYSRLFELIDEIIARYFS